MLNFYRSIDLKNYIDFNDNVLEIGCGTGRYLNEIKRLLKNKPHGIDISLNTIENYTKKHSGILAFHGDFIKYSFDIKYDFIYSITVLEYIPVFRISKFFAKLHSVLKAGGKAYITYPNSNLNRIALIENFNYTKYPEWFIEKICKKLGFEIIESGEMKFECADSEFEGGAYILIKKLKT